MKNLIFTVKGMHCGSCEKIIKMELEELQGLEDIQIDHKTGQGSLKFDPNIVTQDKIVTAIKNSGYETNNVTTN